MMGVGNDLQLGTSQRRRVHTTGAHMTDYDVILIGSGAGGLAAAVPLAQAGLQVLVCEQHEVPGGWTHSFTLNGYRFSPGVHYLGDLEPGGSLRRVYEGLGVSQDLSFCELNPEGYDHIFIGEERFDFPKGRENLIAQLAERFPHEAEGIEGYFQHIISLMNSLQRLGRVRGPAQALQAVAGAGTVLKWARRSGQDLIDIHVSDPLLKGVLAGQAGDHGLPPKRVSAFVHAGITHHYFNGGYYPRGGGFAIPRAFVRALERAGGEMQLKARVAKILLKGRKVVGVRLEDGQEISARHVISNADPEITFGQLIGRQHLSKRLARKLNRLRYSTSALSLFFATDMDLRAAGLDSGNYWFYDHADLNQLYQLGLTGHALHAEAPPMMFLTVTTLKDPSKMRAGVHTCEAFTFVSYDPFEKYRHPLSGVRLPGYQGLKEDLAWRMITALDERIPGLSQHVVFWDLGTPLTNERFINVHRGSLYGIEKSITQVGPGAFSTRTEFENLYLCGASTLSHGVAGVTATGLAAARAILGCQTGELLTQNGPPLAIYPSEDLSQWPEDMQKKIAMQARP